MQYIVKIENRWGKGKLRTSNILVQNWRHVRKLMRKYKILHIEKNSRRFPKFCGPAFLKMMRKKLKTGEMGL